MITLSKNTYCETWTSRLCGRDHEQIKSESEQAQILISQIDTRVLHAITTLGVAADGYYSINYNC